MSAVDPTPAQLEAFAAGDPDPPVVMVNLLAFRERAAYPPDAGVADPDVSGREAYMRYAAVASRTIEEVGGRTLLALPRVEPFIAEPGSPDAAWDMVACVRYPSRAAFLRMVQLPHYREATVHRTAGLARTVLLACPEAAPATGR